MVRATEAAEKASDMPFSMIPYSVAFTEAVFNNEKRSNPTYIDLLGLDRHQCFHANNDLVNQLFVI